MISSHSEAIVIMNCIKKEMNIAESEYAATRNYINSLDQKPGLDEDQAAKDLSDLLIKHSKIQPDLIAKLKAGYEKKETDEHKEQAAVCSCLGTLFSRPKPRKIVPIKEATFYRYLLANFWSLLYQQIDASLCSNYGSYGLYIFERGGVLNIWKHHGGAYFSSKNDILHCRVVSDTREIGLDIIKEYARHLCVANPEKAGLLLNRGADSGRWFDDAEAAQKREAVLVSFVQCGAHIRNGCDTESTLYSAMLGKRLDLIREMLASQKVTDESVERVLQVASVSGKLKAMLLEYKQQKSKTTEVSVRPVLKLALQ